ncbi:hypothetical protein [uncultured Xanthomonas sp.]|uniref:hypothetical protein n=1 Tax=uncultured Xanthomonas sp. TaxID=152831 RepID=UPI0025D3C1D5|nr:hypothetical protein [uncultured Xanthomonas sp.]
MKIDVRIKQSEVRVRSGIRLAFFIAVTASAAWVMDVLWLAKILIFLFCFSLLLHYLNIGMLGDLRGGCNIY